MNAENQTDNSAMRAKIHSLLDRRRLADALAELKKMSEKQLSWETSDRLKALERNYGYMIRYALDGADDPGRKRLYDSMLNEAYMTLDELTRISDRLTTSTLYFGTLRFEQVRAGESLDFLAQRYEQLLASDNPFENAVADTPSADMRRERSQLQQRIFMKIWVTFPLSRRDVDALRRLLLDNPSVADSMKQLLISALLLGGLQYYDPRRLELLLTVYERFSSSSSSAVAPIALTAAVILAARYFDRPFDEGVTAAFDLAGQTPSWVDDLRNVLIELVRTRDTDRINRKMMEEVVPSLMKLRPDLMKHHIDPSELTDIEAIEENPEWQDLLAKSGLGDKIKEMTEIQEDGGDVFMSTFAHLKSFPFFREISNWFIPFATDNPDIESASGNDEFAETIASMLQSSPYLCNSDKYSFLFSIGSVPEAQRAMMLEQMKAYNVNAAEMRAAALNEVSHDRRNFINKYVQDLYRFFHLFARHEEFDDPFDAGSLRLLSTPFAAELVKADPETLHTIGEFYFKHNYFAEALEAFKALELVVPPSAQLFQKIGFCLEKTGRIEEALENYLRSELLDASSVWTLRRIAACYRVLANDEMAVAYYTRVAEAQPENVAVAYDMAVSLIALKRYADAIAALRKVLYLKPEHTRARRRLTRALYLSSDFRGALKEGRPLLENGAEKDDYVTLGLASLALKKYREAADMLHLAVENTDGDIEKVFEAVSDDTPMLAEAGVDRDMIALIVDSLPR